MATSRTAMAALVDAHLAAEQQSDLDQAVAGYTEDVEHDVVGAPGGPLRGPAAARQRYTQLLEHTDRLTELRRFYGDDVCVVEHECSATVFGEFAGLAGRGRSTQFRMLHVFEFRDGLISRENLWMDTASVMAQLAEPGAGRVEVHNQAG